MAIVAFCELLEADKKYVIARQLLKAGTSIGANVREAQNAESKADFIHKLKISTKEADETTYWLELCRKAENFPNPEVLIKQVESMRKLLNSIIENPETKKDVRMS